MIPLTCEDAPNIRVDDRQPDIKDDRVDWKEAVEAISGERITDEDYRPVPELKDNEKWTL